MNEEEQGQFDRWFEHVWKEYPLDLSMRRKGTRQVAYKAALKIKPDTKLQSRILGSMREMARMCREEKRIHGKTDRWPYLSTWLNQSRWEMLADMDKPEAKKAAVKDCDCGKPAVVVDLCNDCYDDLCPEVKARKRMLWERLKELGLEIKDGESREEWRERCRAYALKKTSLGSHRAYRQRVY